jgi:hypothetical protein
MRASESDRGLICPASLVRPRSAARTANADKAANWGTLVHSWKENGDTRGNRTLDKKLALVDVDREKLWPTVGARGVHELTFSLNLTTLQLRIWSPSRSKFTSDRWKRRHPRASYLTGTLDYLSTRNGLPWVDDLKTGSWPVSARKSHQLRSYALVPWILADCNTDVWVSITQWPKYTLRCKPQRKWHLLKSADLARHLQKLKWAVSSPDVAVPSKEGCMFCPSRIDCNEYQESRFS